MDAENELMRGLRAEPEQKEAELREKEALLQVHWGGACGGIAVRALQRDWGGGVKCPPREPWGRGCKCLAPTRAPAVDARPPQTVPEPPAAFRQPLLQPPVAALATAPPPPSASCPWT